MNILCCSIITHTHVTHVRLLVVNIHPASAASAFCLSCVEEKWMVFASYSTDSTLFYHSSVCRFVDNPRPTAHNPHSPTKSTQGQTLLHPTWPPSRSTSTPPPHPTKFRMSQKQRLQGCMWDDAQCNTNHSFSTLYHLPGLQSIPPESPEPLVHLTWISRALASLAKPLPTSDMAP